MTIKRLSALLLALGMILASLPAAGENYRVLKEGNAGDDVLALKQRLYDLGYYSTTKLNGSYNESAVSVVRQFQYAN
ncbi:MAG: peptidoglycan-binding protein, partial [Clostridia bacterium]|nr:peptidoglycan-binding protein [Clostridia bacterium]